MARVRTGDVAQIRQHGRNYIVLGKAQTTDGDEQVLLIKNGNVLESGQIRSFPRNRKPIVHVVNSGEIKRIHGRRSINLDDARIRIPGLSRVLIRMDNTNGIECSAPNLNAISSHIENLNDH